jgi:metal-responsive CopG/Arc/MetJ family transcriptional regulator
MPLEQEQVRITVRVPAALAHALDRVARREERSLSAEIRRLMRLRVEEFGGDAHQEAVAV